MLYFVSTFFCGIGIFLLSYIDPRSTAIDIIIPDVYHGVRALALVWRNAPTSSPSLCRRTRSARHPPFLALVRNISGAFGVAIFSTLLDNSINGNVFTIAQHSILNGTGAQLMEQFTSLIILKAQVAGYATVFEVAAWIVILGSFTALLINIPKEAINASHHVVAE